MTTHMQTRLHAHTHTQAHRHNNINKSKHVPHSLTRRRMLTTAQRMQQAERPNRARRAQERTATWLAAQKREREQNITVEERQLGSGRDRESAHTRTCRACVFECWRQKPSVAGAVAACASASAAAADDVAAGVACGFYG